MLVSYMQVSAGDEQRALDPQRDPLLAVSVDERHRWRAPARDGWEYRGTHAEERRNWRDIPNTAVKLRI